MNTNERTLEELKRIAKENGYTFISQFDKNVIDFLKNKITESLPYYSKEEMDEIIDNAINEKICNLDLIFNS